MGDVPRQAAPSSDHTDDGGDREETLAAHLHTAFLTVADGLVLVDFEGEILLANPAAVQTIQRFGHGGPVVGEQLATLDVRLVDEDGRPVTVADLYEQRHALRSTDDLTVRVGAIAPDGTIAWFELRARTSSGPANQRVALVSVREITEERRQVRSAQRLERLQAVLADVNELLSHRLEIELDADEWDVSTFLHDVCRVASDVGGYPAVQIGLRDEHGTMRPAVSCGTDIALPQSFVDGIGRREVRTAAEAGHAWLIVEIAGGGRRGALALAVPSLDRPDDQERSLVVELAADVSHGLELHAQAQRRRAAEQAVRTSEEWFRALVQHASDLVMVIDAAGTITYVTPGGGAMVGRDPEALVGQSAEGLIEPEDRAELQAWLDDTKTRAGTAPVITFRTRHVDGTVRWVRAVANNQLDNPAVRGIVINAHDVTDEHEARIRLEFQARLLASVGEAVIATDPDGRILHWNDAAEQLYGWSAEEAIGQLVHKLVPPVDPDLPRRTSERMRLGHSWSGEIEVRRRDGTMVPVQAFDRPVLDEHGRITALIGTSFDVTGQRQAEHDALARARQHATVAALSQQVLRTRDLDALLTEATDAVREGLDVDVARALIRSSSNGALVVRAASGSDRLPLGHELEPDEAPLAASVLDGRRSIAVDDLGSSAQRSHVAENDDAASGMAAVIECQGVAEGALLVLSRPARQFTSEEIDFLQSVANLVSAAMEAERSEERLQHLALHDPLTGLPNRTLFRDRLDQAIRRHERDETGIAVLFCDLDRFKMVNDALGHAIGDQLLREVAGRLVELVRPGDTVARFGGDEFAVLCDDVDAPAVGLEVARRITRTLGREPIDLAGAEVLANLSIGVAACVDGGCTAEELLRNADAAMYRAKDLGRGRAELFHSDDRDALLERFELTTALSSALARDQFVLRYQPEVELDGTTVWVEALLRWQHPSRGELDPSQFMAIAEETGEIADIGAWALRQALADFARWQTDAGADAPSCVSVNLSARQLQEPDLIGSVRDALADSGVEPAALWFEITETAVLVQPDLAAEVLDELKELGVGLAIDDFGTGYSSLTYARRLPADALKIDRSFVSGMGSDLRDHSIASAVIGLAHTLGILAIAEGVETEQQLAALRRDGCDYAQGYLWARPLAADDVVAWVRDHRYGRLDG